MNEKIIPDFDPERMDGPSSREEKIRLIAKSAASYEEFMARLQRDLGPEFAQTYGQGLWMQNRKQNQE